MQHILNTNPNLNPNHNTNPKTNPNANSDPKAKYSRNIVV